MESGARSRPRLDAERLERHLLCGLRPSVPLPPLVTVVASAEFARQPSGAGFIIGKRRVMCKPHPSVAMVGNRNMLEELRYQHVVGGRNLRVLCDNRKIPPRRPPYGRRWKA
jgi:hypothetical protein